MRIGAHVGTRARCRSDLFSAEGGQSVGGDPYAPRVLSAVLDSTELSSDFMCTGLKFQLVDYTLHESWLSLFVPASVVEETIANHERQIAEFRSAAKRLSQAGRRLGLSTLEGEVNQFDYREYLAERMDRLGITVLPWPTVSHEELVARAVSRRPPFDEKGSGYRDSLLWADAVQLAASGRQVALVSSDSVFAGPDGVLALALQEEIVGLPGTIELVRNFGQWLVDKLPWQAGDLKSAVAESRDRQFYDFFLQSDVQNDLVPEIEDLGLRRDPETYDITEASWDGWFESVKSSQGPDGLSLVEYEPGFDVSFEADYLGSVDPEPDWDITEDAFLRTHVTGTVRMIARIAVLFGDELVGFEIDDVSWRRADGTGRGELADGRGESPDQPTLLNAPQR